MSTVEQQREYCVKQISLWCVAEIYSILGGLYPMAIVGGGAIDYYLDTGNAADTDVAVCVPVPEGHTPDPTEFIFATTLQNNAALLILRNLIVILRHVDHMWNQLWSTLFPSGEGTVIPATVQMNAGHRLSIHLAAAGYGNGKSLEVSKSFPFCVLVIPDTDRRDHVLITVRMRQQEGTITNEGGTFPYYPGILDFAIKRPTAPPCNVTYPITEERVFTFPPSYKDEVKHVPYMLLIPLLESQIVLVNNIPEGGRKRAKITRLRELWERFSVIVFNILSAIDVLYYNDLESRIRTIIGPPTVAGAVAAIAEGAVAEGGSGRRTGNAEGVVAAVAEGGSGRRTGNSNKKGGSMRKTKSRQLRKKRRTITRK